MYGRLTPNPRATSPLHQINLEIISEMKCKKDFPMVNIIAYGIALMFYLVCGALLYAFGGMSSKGAPRFGSDGKRAWLEV